ncbi:MAG: hypothetical protein QF718_03535 [Phycisphaerales bacterium]|jgi:hypothetical protein|nr:hypothetical protein [Phycisphaerales bacterium]
MKSQLSLLLTIFSVILLTGCTANPPVTDPLSIAPNDFSLDITVVTTEPHTLAHMKSSRFVVFPNGALHHGDEDGWGPNTLPARTRLLSREQIAIIWNRLDQMGMSSPKRADETVNFQLLPKPKDGSVYMIAVNGDGKYWNFIRYISKEQQADPAFKKLIRLLADYAWATDLPDVEGYEEPVRYDLGGNPYERYVEGETQ